MVDAGGLGLGGRAETAEPVGRVHPGGVGQVGGQAVGRGVLVADQIVGVVRAEQVGPAHRAVQQRAAGEDRDLVAPASARA